MNIVLAVSFNKDQGTIIAQKLLAGAQYTSIDASGQVDAQGNVIPGFATTSLFAPVFDNSTNPPTAVGINANAANPDLTTANALLNASTFINASAANLLQSHGKAGLKLAQCTQPWITVGTGKKAQTVCPDGNLPDGGE
jgi:hypothetical protein